MEEFSRERFEKAPGRAALCAALVAVLAAKLSETVTFHETVYAIVRELKGVGHDLTSYDESDDMQTWGPDYVRQSARGLVITFTVANDVDVEWKQ